MIREIDMDHFKIVCDPKLLQEARAVHQMDDIMKSLGLRDVQHWEHVNVAIARICGFNVHDSWRIGRDLIHERAV